MLKDKINSVINQNVKIHRNDFIGFFGRLNRGAIANLFIGKDRF